MIYFEDFLKATLQYVKYSETTANRGDRFNTYALLEEYSDLDVDHLGKGIRSKEKIDFYSREWESKGYNKSDIGVLHPFLIVFQKHIDVTDIMSPKRVESEVVEIASLDIYDHEKCLSGQGSKSEIRNRYEIFRDTKRKLYAYLTYLSECKYYHGYGVLHPSIANALGLNPNTIDEQFSRIWQMSINKENRSAHLQYWDGGIRMMYGVTVQLKIRYMSCETYQYNIDTQKVIRDYQG